MKKVQLFAAAVVAVAMTACAAPAEEAEVVNEEVTEEVVAEEEVAEEADSTAEEATEEVAEEAAEEAAADEHEGHDHQEVTKPYQAKEKSHYCVSSSGISYLRVVEAARTTSFKTTSSVRSTFLQASNPQMFLAQAAFKRNRISSMSVLDKSSKVNP